MLTMYIHTIQVEENNPNKIWNRWNRNSLFYLCLLFYRQIDIWQQDRLLLKTTCFFLSLSHDE
jgi:hypothetical protein